VPPVTIPPAARFEDQVARDEGVSDHDIHYSRLSGMAPADIDVLCDFSREEALLIIVRCPRRPARYFHGRYAPKPMSVKIKSDPTTALVALPGGTMLVSDYDLMCVYRFLGDPDGYEKIMFSAANPNRPEILPPEASALLNKVNWRLNSPFQHGAQDDFESRQHPNVRMATEGRSPPDRFMAFNLGLVEYFGNPALVQKYYAKHGLDWPYGTTGRHRSADR
jgi:hypothetical protein